MSEDNRSFITRLSLVFRGYRTTEYALLIYIVGIATLLCMTFLGYMLYDLFWDIKESIPDAEIENK